MITKAIVTAIIDNCSVKVRIPIYDKISGVQDATPDDQLSIASICSIPNLVPNLKINDVVFVDFEEDNIGKPVILGALLTNNQSTTYPSVKVDSINVQNQITLPLNTKIGDVTGEEIQFLKGLAGNVQGQLDYMPKGGHGGNYTWGELKEEFTWGELK